MRAELEPSDHLQARNEARCRHLLDRSELVRVDDLDWGSVGARPVEDGVLTSLVYMRDVEGFTPSYLVGLAAHRTTLADPIVHDFLDVWQAEEAAHSAAIDRYLRAYGAVAGVAVEDQPLPQPSTAAWYEQVLGRTGGPIGRTIAAAHMTWGAANELLTMNGYRMLADRCGDPVLRELLTRIAAQEARHYAFYLLQAEWRLAASPLARQVIPRFLARAWTPVGIGDGYKTAAEFQQVVEVLTARPDSERLIDRMDRRFSALPGLAGLRIYQRAINS